MKFILILALGIIINTKVMAQADESKSTQTVNTDDMGAIDQSHKPESVFDGQSQPKTQSLKKHGSKKHIKAKKHLKKKHRKNKKPKV